MGDGRSKKEDIKVNDLRMDMGDSCAIAHVLSAGDCAMLVFLGSMIVGGGGY